MIARRRARCCVIHLKDDKGREREEGGVELARTPIDQRGFRGHIIVYPQYVDHLDSVLPPALETAVTPICVVFVGSTRPSKEWLLDKAKPLIVRRERIRAALRWLKIHNPLYQDIVIDEDAINQLPVCDVAPVEINLEEESPAMSSIGSRYDNPPPEDPSDPANSTAEDVFHNAVVTDLNCSNVSSKDLASAALRHLHGGGGFLQMPHGKDPCNEYHNPTLFPLMYPTLFPYGTGGFDDDARTSKIGMKTQVKHFMSLKDRRFQTHYSFLFSVFNILQRRAVSLSAKIKVGKASFGRFAIDMRNLSLNALSAVVKRLEDSGKLFAENEDERLVLRLMKEVNVVSKFVPGSSASKLSMRNEIRGMMMHLGLPSFYLTINPADTRNPLVRFLNGEEFDLDSMMTSDSSTYWRQAKLVANNPFVSAKFFDIQMKAFFEHLLAFDPKMGSVDGGVFGRVKGYYGVRRSPRKRDTALSHAYLVGWRP